MAKSRLRLVATATAVGIAILGLGTLGQVVIEASLPGTSMELELAEIVVHPSSELAGTTLAGADVRRGFGLIVVALKRENRSTFNPGPDETIEAGDVLVALGPTQAVERIERAPQ